MSNQTRNDHRDQTMNGLSRFGEEQIQRLAERKANEVNNRVPHYPHARLLLSQVFGVLQFAAGISVLLGIVLLFVFPRQELFIQTLQGIGLWGIGKYGRQWLYPDVLDVS